MENIHTQFIAMTIESSRDYWFKINEYQAIQVQIFLTEDKTNFFTVKICKKGFFF